MADLGAKAPYEFGLTQELVKTFAEIEGLKPEYVRAYAGSSEPLHYTVLAFTSPEKSLVMGIRRTRLRCGQRCIAKQSFSRFL